MYLQKRLDSFFFIQRGFYVFFMPVKVPYQEIYSRAESAGVIKKEALGPILEQGKMFGFGWIGIEIERPSEMRLDVIHIEGDFQMYEHQGPYKDLGKVYKKIMKENPGAKEYFNLYLDDPKKVDPKNLRTQILFR